jgi:hypothetical protein
MQSTTLGSCHPLPPPPPQRVQIQERKVRNGSKVSSFLRLFLHAVPNRDVVVGGERDPVSEIFGIF